MATKAEIEQRRAERAAKHAADREAQETLDLEAIDKLEAANADGEPLHTMTSNRFTPGVPVKVAFRAPEATEYKRYCDQVGRAQKQNDHQARQKAQELLAESCLVYPAVKSEERKALIESSPGTLISLAIEVARVAELRAEEEGKG